jgi:hypothetical protein
MTVILALEKLFCDEKRTVLSALQSGAIIAYPTDTIYGLGVDAYNAKAVCNLLELKRPAVPQTVQRPVRHGRRVFRDFPTLKRFTYRKTYENYYKDKYTLCCRLLRTTTFPGKLPVIIRWECGSSAWKP